jgi:hypothetical protein
MLGAWLFSSGQNRRSDCVSKAALKRDLVVIDDEVVTVVLMVIRQRTEPNEDNHPRH